MRIVTRIGVTLSVVAALALYGVQYVAGLVAMLGVVVIGVLAGLGVAKWLERAWYGRQLEAGARAGAIACGVAGLSSALYLLGSSPTSMTVLADRSQLLGSSFVSLVLSLSPIGPVGAIIACAVVSTLLGVAASAITAQVFGVGKDKHAVDVVAQARLAAQAMQKGELGAQTNATGAPAPAPSVRLFGRSAPMTISPATARTAAPAPHPELPAPAFTSWDDESSPDASQSSAKKKPAKRGRAQERPVSHARSADHAMTTEEREALLAWDDELSDDSQPDLGAREPKKSAFLNESLASPRRNRKKQNTRDWLC